MRRRGWAVLCAATVLAALLAGFASSSAARAAPNPCATATKTGLYLIPGLSRGVWAYVPRAASRPGVRRPVMMLLHGSGSNGAEMINAVKMGATAEKYGFIVVAPNGGIVSSTDPKRGRLYIWDIPGFFDGTSLGGERDDAYLSALISVLPQRFCMDPARTSMAGFSGGGRMTSQFACRHRDLLAAIAPVAALRAGAPVRGEDGAYVPGTCAETGSGRPPLPVVSFHGTADPVNPYDGEPAATATARWGYSVPTAFARWGAINRCAASPAETVFPVLPRTRLFTFSGCAVGVKVELIRTSGPGADSAHDWPLSTTFNANEIIWNRFATARR